MYACLLLYVEVKLELNVLELLFNLTLNISIITEYISGVTKYRIESQSTASGHNRPRQTLHNYVHRPAWGLVLHPSFYT